MKYGGTIIGFRSNFGSVYNIPVDDTRCYIWKANIIAETSERLIKVLFNWNGETYEMRLSEVKENYYSGNIVYNRVEHGGSAFFWRYSNGENVILKGDFQESDSDTYDCFVELRPLTTN